MSRLALRLAELALRVVPPLIRAAQRDRDVSDIEGRQAWLRREIKRMREERQRR